MTVEDFEKRIWIAAFVAEFAREHEFRLRYPQA